MQYTQLLIRGYYVLWVPFKINTLFMHAVYELLTVKCISLCYNNVYIHETHTQYNYTCHK